VTIPVVGTDYATGRALVDRANAGSVTLQVKVDGFINENFKTNNVIAETRVVAPIGPWWLADTWTRSTQDLASTTTARVCR
jgi:hypothetical protein